ncbi:MAG: NYN domain-containing protein [Clostridiales bacterium]|jgi:predicted RNA-binding protein with PIN domain|nr:NYN domain-containing protein [Clostridiales bacterium]
MKGYLLVDGYNIIFAWAELRAAANEISLDAARERLTDVLRDYAALTGLLVILVFDAYRVKRGESVEKRGRVRVVYTKERDTADAYIERAAGRLLPQAVFVATDDILEQVVILGRGAFRISSAKLRENVEAARRAMEKRVEDAEEVKPNRLSNRVDKETAAALERMRRGEW